jgi:hypothetical protein
MITGEQFAQLALSFPGTQQVPDKAIFPVPNKWGEKGATTFDLNHVPKHILTEALLSAYNEVINSKKKK